MRYVLWLLVYFLNSAVLSVFVEYVLYLPVSWAISVLSVFVGYVLYLPVSCDISVLSVFLGYVSLTALRDVSLTALWDRCLGFCCCCCFFGGNWFLLHAFIDTFPFCGILLETRNNVWFMSAFREFIFPVFWRLCLIYVKSSQKSFVLVRLLCT